MVGAGLEDVMSYNFFLDAKLKFSMHIRRLVIED